MKEVIIDTKIQICSYDELPQEEKMLLDAAKEATTRSYAPYSKFHVGVALLLANGEVITGNNQENAAYPSGLCAERVTLMYANSLHPQVPVKTMVLAAQNSAGFTETEVSPCGACRQVILESELRQDSPIRIIMYGTNHIYIVDSIKALLPLCFDKEQLGTSTAPL